MFPHASPNPLPSPLPEVIAVLNSVSAFSTARIEALVNKLKKEEQDDLAAGLNKVATNSDWGRLARAWLLLELKTVGAVTENPPGVWR